MFKRTVKVLGIILGAIVFLLAALVVFLTVTEYKPLPRAAADRISTSVGSSADDKTLTVYTWNIGYAGLGKDSDFFMDGGKMVYPPSKEAVENNLSAIRSFIESTPADAWLLQEVDVNSSRTNSIDQFSQLQSAVSGGSAFAYNYKCPFVPIPFPPLGKVESGVATLSELSISENAERISLPCPFSWPVRAANIKRCLLVTRTEIEGSDKELVLVNLHLEAYESGEGRIAQTKQLVELMQDEYAKGNYVIAGGDFNQSFPGALDIYPITDSEKWTPGILEPEVLPEGWSFASDSTNATCRLLDQPYCDECQLYVIDGFILSPNVQLEEVETVQLNFEHSDHNPVRLTVNLLG